MPPTWSVIVFCKTSCSCASSLSTSCLKTVRLARDTGPVPSLSLLVTVLVTHPLVAHARPTEELFYDNLRPCGTARERDRTQ